MSNVTRAIATVVVVATLFLARIGYGAQETRGEVTDVTVYRDQALVVRTLRVEGGEGTREIVVTDLPDRISSDSLATESDEQCTVHSVTYRSRAVSQDSRPEVEEIDNELRELERKMREIEAERNLVRHNIDTISRLQTFTIQTSQKELEYGVLDFEQLRGLTEYGFEKRRDFMEHDLELQMNTEDVHKEIELLHRKRSEIARSHNNNEREAVIYLTKNTEAPVAIKLSYLVSNVSWTPKYNIRTNEKREGVQMEYNAFIRQMSGEDWEDVNLTLSTARPSFAATPPTLEPLSVSLGEKVVIERYQAVDLYASNLIQIAEVQQRGGHAKQRSKYLNDFARGNQLLINNGDAWFSNYGIVEIARTEGVSVAYKLAHPVSLSSRNDRQMLQIATTKIPAAFTYIATPLLTDFVFEECRVTNTSSVVFLPGAYDSYLDGEFVGKGDLELIASGEEFIVGFGVNPQVQVNRRVVRKKEKIGISNKTSDYEYEITIANYQNNDIHLRLEDRIPYSPDGSVQVKLIETLPSLSEDEQYLKNDQPKGLLRWDLEIPAGTVKEEPVVIQYKYKLVHDKQKSLK